MMKAKIFITLKNGVLDPQGLATQGALTHLGFSNVDTVKQGKFIEVTLNETNEHDARKHLDNMCEQLLANTVIENYEYELIA